MFNVKRWVGLIGLTVLVSVLVTGLMRSPALAQGPNPQPSNGWGSRIMNGWGYNSQQPNSYGYGRDGWRSNPYGYGRGWQGGMMGSRGAGGGMMGPGMMGGWRYNASAPNPNYTAPSSYDYGWDDCPYGW